MSRSRKSLVVLVVMIAATLAAPTAWGAPRQASGERLATDLIARLWHSFTALWAGEGCILDPHGGCRVGSATPPAGVDGRFDP